MDRLVARLVEGKHPLIFELKNQKYDEIKERLLKMKYVLIKFTDTIGETELGITVDDSFTNLTKADFENGKGTAHIIGTCELNYHKVRCIAKLDLATKKGTAYLELIN